MRSPLIPGTLCLLILLPAAGRLPAAEKLDLDRLQPVPAGQTIPLSDFFRHSLLSEPKLNPSGTHIAARVTTNDDRRQLMIVELKTKQIEMLAGESDNDIYQVNWLDDRRLIFGIGLRKRYGVGLFATEVGGFLNCYPLLQYVGSSLIAIPPKDRLRPLVAMVPDSLNAGQNGQAVVINTTVHSGPIINAFKAGTRYDQILRVEEANQRHITTTYPGPGGGFGAGFLADAEGRLELGFTSENGRFTLYRREGDKWEKSPADLDAIDVLGYGRARGEIAVQGPRQEGRPRALQFMDTATGRLGDVLLQDKAYDFDGYLYHDAGTRNIVGAVFNRSGPQVVWFNDAYRGLQKFLNGQFPGLVARIIGSDEAGTIFLVMTYSDRQPAIYYSVDLGTRAVGLIKRSAPWIDPERMRPMSIMKYKTRDGRALDAYVTLPAGASKANPPPLVVLVHDLEIADGAFANMRDRDTWGFDPQVQFLASRGYAVLQANYRGSGGYDWMFPGEKEWDFAGMTNDLADATRELVTGGWIDGRRVAVMGTGFGGYLAAASAVAEPNLYRCAVSIEGIYDWGQELQDEKYYQFSDYYYGALLRRVGNPEKERARFDAISPARQAARARGPLLVAYEKVFVRGVTQAKLMISQLEKQAVPHEVVAVGDERFGLAHLDNYVGLYQRIEAFLEKNLSPATPAPAPATPAAPAAGAP